MISVSKNMYIDVLADLVNKYNNAYHRAIKITFADVTSSTYINFSVKNMRKILNLSLVTM